MILRLILLMITCSAAVVSRPSVAQERPAEPEPAVMKVRMDVFVRSDRDSAQRVAVYVQDLERRVKGLEIRVHDVIKDQDQLRRLYELSREVGRPKPVLPAFSVCRRMYFGFVDTQKSGPAIEGLLNANLYTRSTCARCQQLKAFLPKLKQRWPAIRFVIHDVDRSAADRSTWQALCRSAGSVPGLPTIDFARRIIIGYQGDEVTGAQLDALMQEASGIKPREPLSRNRGASFPNANASTLELETYAAVFPSMFLLAQATSEQATAELDLLELPDEAEESEIGASEAPVETVSDDTIDVPFFGRLSVSELGMPIFTLAVGLVDGFNPCAMWVLVFLLSVLVNIKDRRKILAIAGTFVVISGVAYFAFMAAWLEIFMLIGIARPVQITLGILAIFIGVVNVKDFFAFKKGVSISIPESQKPKLYRRVREIVNAKYLTVALTGAVGLAIVVNMVELLCTAGLPALYTQVLTLQDYPAWKNYGFLLLYIAAYMFDDALLVAIVVTTLSHRKLQEREGRWLKLLSGLVILLLGLVMLFRPDWLKIGV